MTEYYIKDLNDYEMYARDADKNELYIATDDPEKLYALRPYPVYAKKNTGDEIYGRIGNKDVLLKRNKRQVYARDSAQNEFYPVDENNREFLAVNELNQVYMAIDNDQNEKYPKDENGDEYQPVPDLFAKNNQGILLLPASRPYAVVNGNEIYELHLGENTYLFAVDENGNPRYARKSNGDEYYPPNNQAITNEDGIGLYASTHTDDIIFPRIEHTGDEMYFTDYAGDQIVPLLLFAGRVRYARDANGNEIYPETSTPIGFVENSWLTYAKEATGNIFYPLDAYGNEYVFKDLPIEDMMPVGYPITNDEYYIVPGVSDKPLFLKNSQISEKNIIGMISRDGVTFEDYLTNVKSNRKARKKDSMPRKAYVVKEFQFKQKNYNWIIWLGLFAIGIFFMYALM